MKNLLKRKVKFSTGFVLPILVVLSTPSMADIDDFVAGSAPRDAKTFPGTLCLPEKGARVVNNTTGVLYNDSNRNQIWTCPIVRDVMAGKNNGISSARVAVIDNHNGNNVLCTLKSLSFLGGLVEQVTRQTSVPFKSSNAISLNGFSNIQSTNGGHYVLRCRVPGKQGRDRSGIRAYRIVEAK